MPLELHRPPLLVGVSRSGTVLPALLLASRGDRRYVQLSRGPGSNHLMWVAADDLRPGLVPVPPCARADAAGSGLPWGRPRGQS